MSVSDSAQGTGDCWRCGEEIAASTPESVQRCRNLAAAADPWWGISSPFPLRCAIAEWLDREADQ